MHTNTTNPLMKTVLLVVLLALSLGVDSAWAQRPGGRMADCDGRGPGAKLERMAEHLELTAEQQEAIAQIHEDSKAEMVELRKDLMRLRNEKQGEMLKDDPSQRTVLDLTERMGEIKTRMQLNRMQTRLDIRQQLTPEQRDKMMMKKDRRGKRGRPGKCGGKCGSYGGGHKGHQGCR